MRTSLRVVLAAALTAMASGASPAQTMDLELPTLDGKRFFHLSAERGRPVVINFWGDDCPPCVREMPLLDRMAKLHSEALFVGVSVVPRMNALNFADSHPVSYLLLAGPSDPRGTLRRFGNPVGALPHTVVLRPDHSRCAIWTGEIRQDWLESALRRCG